MKNELQGEVSLLAGSRAHDGAEDGGWSFEGDAITRFFLLKICFISSFEAALLSKLVTSLLSTAINVQEH